MGETWASCLGNLLLRKKLLDSKRMNYEEVMDGASARVWYHLTECKALIMAVMAFRV